MKRSGNSARTARRRTPKSPRTTAGTTYKAAAIAELVARIRRAIGTLKLGGEQPLGGSSDRFAGAALSQRRESRQVELRTVADDEV